MIFYPYSMLFNIVEQYYGSIFSILPQTARMKKYFTLFILIGTFFLSDAQTILDKAKNAIAKNAGVSADEAGLGIKEALNNGVKGAVSFFNKPDGFLGNEFYKVLLPEEAKKMEKTLRDIGMGKMVDDAIVAINRGAEDAVGFAAPIFINAIKQMTITDALKLISGDKASITNYFREKTSVALKAAFLPIIKQSLDKTNGTKYYGDAVNRYNKIPFVKKMNPDLADHVANKTLFALFDRLAVEEKNIRSNPAARTSDLLKKVFGN